MSRPLLALVLLGLAARAAPTLAHSASRPASSRPTTAAVELQEHIDRLASTHYHEREAAERLLADRGEAALDALLLNLDHKDAEVRRRIAAILPTPREPEARTAAAVRLIATGDREFLSKAIYMLFLDPTLAARPFRVAASRQSGVAAAMCAPIAEELQMAAESAALSARSPLPEDADLRERRLRSQTELRASRAEAAFWLALDARDEFLARTSTRPAP